MFLKWVKIKVEGILNWGINLRRRGPKLARMFLVSSCDSMLRVCSGVIYRPLHLSSAIGLSLTQTEARTSWGIQVHRVNRPPQYAKGQKLQTEMQQLSTLLSIWSRALVMTDSGNEDWWLMTHEDLQQEHRTLQNVEIFHLLVSRPCSHLMSSVDDPACTLIVNGSSYSEHWLLIKALLHGGQAVCLHRPTTASSGQKRAVPSISSKPLFWYRCRHTGWGSGFFFFVTLRPQSHGVGSVLWLKGIY